MNENNQNINEVDIAIFFYENPEDYLLIERLTDVFEVPKEDLEKLLSIMLGKKIIGITSDKKYHWRGKAVKLKEILETTRDEQICANISEYYLGSPEYLIVDGILKVYGGIKYPMGESAYIFEITEKTKEITALITYNMRILKLTNNSFSFIYYDTIKEKPIKSSMIGKIFYNNFKSIFGDIKFSSKVKQFLNKI
jgi:hypothetical protein